MVATAIWLAAWSLLIVGLSTGDFQWYALSMFFGTGGAVAMSWVVADIACARMEKAAGIRSEQMIKQVARMVAAELDTRNDDGS